MTCPKYPRSLLLLFVLLLMIPAGTIGLASPLAQAPLTRKAQVVSGACQESGRSNPQIGQLLTTLPSHQTAEAYDTLGVLYAQQRQLRCAIPAFEQAIKLNPRDWRTRYNFAVALADGGETKRAIKQLQILLRQNPDSAAAHNMLGSLLEREGTLEAAADELKAALKRDPGLAPAALALAHILITQKRYSAALVYLDDALKSSPPAELEEQLRSAVAVAQAENGNFESAVETLGQVIKSHPDAADAYFNLATLYAKKGPSLGYEGDCQFPGGVAN
jgi:tetratricopeptide (TPR) repeat protein